MMKLWFFYLKINLIEEFVDFMEKMQKQKIKAISPDGSIFSNEFGLERVKIV